jgi:hypothetical protein
MGPYKIIKVISPVSYMLALPKTMKIHPVIHISQLRKYEHGSPFSPKYEQPAPEMVDGHEEYEVEKIIDKRIHYRRAEYLVKWKGYGEEDNSWLPHWKLENSSELLKNFDKHEGKKKIES